jgi:hypothetical protein
VPLQLSSDDLAALTHASPDIPAMAVTGAEDPRALDYGLWMVVDPRKRRRPTRRAGHQRASIWLAYEVNPNGTRKFARGPMPLQPAGMLTGELRHSSRSVAFMHR